MVIRLRLVKLCKQPGFDEDPLAIGTEARVRVVGGILMAGGQKRDLAGGHVDEVDITGEGVTHGPLAVRRPVAVPEALARHQAAPRPRRSELLSRRRRG